MKTAILLRIFGKGFFPAKNAVKFGIAIATYFKQGIAG
jgi:hypothetical protein